MLLLVPHHLGDLLEIGSRSAYFAASPFYNRISMVPKGFCRLSISPSAQMPCICRVITDDSHICIRSETILDLQRRTAIGLDVRKPEAKGFMDTCKMLPDRQTSDLLDTVDYYLNHAAAKH